jgi:hypothetical protein
MRAHRLLFSALLLAAAAAMLPAGAHAANKPKSNVSLLGSHPNGANHDARLALLKQRSSTIPRSNPKPGRTVQSLNRHSGKTLGINTSTSK